MPPLDAALDALEEGVGEGWAAAGSIDTDLSFLSLLELYGTDIPERRVPTSRVIEPLDVIEHISPRLFPAAVRPGRTLRSSSTGTTPSDHTAAWETRRRIRPTGHCCRQCGRPPRMKIPGAPRVAHRVGRFVASADRRRGQLCTS